MRPLLPRRRNPVAMPVVMAVAGFSAVAMAAQARATSTTFEEIALVAAGARALGSGEWDFVAAQPPAAAGVFGATVLLSAARLPPETRPGGRSWEYHDRWDYARSLYFERGNDPERLALVVRGAAIVMAVALVFAVFGWAAGVGGEGAGTLAAVLAASLPDVLAHGALAYNDVPAVLALVLAAWALDRMVRWPSPGRGVAAGALVGLAVATKYGGLALLPLAVVLVALEAVGRPRDPGWWKAVGIAAAAGALAGYAVLVLLYGGDLLLRRWAMGMFMSADALRTGGADPALLPGAMAPVGGWRIHAPIVFLYKTPVAFQALVVAGLAGVLLGGRRGRGWRGLADARLRCPAVVLLVFAVALAGAGPALASRHLLPAVVALLVVSSVGLARIWARRGVAARAAIVALLVFQAASTLSTWPHFLAYRSEWIRGRPPLEPARLVRSTDWGQGLVALRRWMEEEGVDRVALGYFGSAAPRAYGIDYRALPSFFPLRAGAAPDVEPAVTALSASLVLGLHVPGDPFAAHRARPPDHVLGGSILVWDDRATRGSGPP